MSGMEAQEMTSQLQAMEEGDKWRRRRRRRQRGQDAGKSPKRCSLTESLNNAANSIKDQKPETPMKTASSSSSSAHPSKESPKAVEKPNDKEGIEEERNGVTDTLMRAVGTDWSELDETVKTNIAKNGTRPLQAVLKTSEKTMKAEENRSAVGLSPTTE